MVNLNLKNSISIQTKIFLTFLIIIFIGYGITFFYIMKYENEILIDKEMKKLENKAEQTLFELKNHLIFLKKEAAFLSKLEIMDDIIAKDIDKRVSNLLKKKAQDLGENIIFAVIDNNGKIVASSQENIKLSFSKLKKEEEIIQNFFIITIPVTASFDSNRHIGKLILLYPLKNLEKHLKNNEGIYSWITSDIVDFKKPEISGETLEVKKRFFAPLQNLILHYAVDKKIALETVYHVQTLLNIVFLIMILLTSIFIFFISKNLVLPIKSLYETAHYIIKTGDYNKEIYSNRQDEIGNLTKIFNILIKKTKESLDSIKAQSKKYEESLIDLIEFFNTITKTESKYDTITVAIRELKRLMNTQDIFFTTDKSEFKNAFMLNIDVKNFKENRSENLGTIVIHNPANQITNLKRFYNSIAQMISLQIERISLMEELKETLRAKSSFLSAMSHELKTPIGSILSLSQYLLTSSKLDQNDLESVSKIEHSANHLLQIINDILTIAKADSGKIDMNISKIDIPQTIKEVLDILNPLAESKGVKIINDIKGELKINTDPKLFKIVIINLISNAIKFTPKGDIHLSLKKEKNDYKIYIKDCGIGIDKEDIKYIFDEFYQGKIYKSGTGLGLAISKKFAALLKGDIIVHSEGVGKGTTTIFVFNSF